MSMMRAEAKHSVFKNFARATNNFININKTLANKHQEMMSLTENNFKDNISDTKRKQIDAIFLRQQTLEMLDLNESHKIVEVGSMTCNSYQYQRRTVFFHNCSLHIVFIVLFAKNEYYFVIEKLEVIGIDEYSGSIRVKFPRFQPKFEMFKFADLQNKQVYASKAIGNDYFYISRCKFD